MRRELWLIGCGDIFETIASTWSAIEPHTSLNTARLESTDAIGVPLGEKLPPPGEGIRFFAAVDQNALNFARFDLYKRMRLAGYRFTTLVHPLALVDSTAALGENCWIGPGANLGPQVKVGHNTIVNAAALLERAANVSANCWIGTAARVGAGSVVGTHTVLGADVRVGSGIEVGRYCSIDVPGHYVRSLPDRSYIDPLFALPVQIYGRGMQRRQSRT